MAGGSGLWFLIRVPTEKYEDEAYSTKKKKTLGPSSVSKGENGSPVNKTGSGTTPETDLQLVPLEHVLKKTLEELRIFNALWTIDKEEKFYQVSFTRESGLPCDVILTTLTTSGIGLTRGSSLVILPCSVILQDEDESLDASVEELNNHQSFEEERTSSAASTLSKTKTEVKKAIKNFKDMQKKFLQTVTARLTVAQVVDGVKAGAAPTFDFIMFVLLASMISALGLLENSSVVIVASMLVSPIMGPILAGTFGAVIRDKSLRNIGIKTEILGLFLCVTIGYFFGVMSEGINGVWRQKEWPTTEMISRGQERSLWVGLLIALPSGAGVALSVLAGNAGCLVGVAISASLLPPAVNAGLLWGMATIRTIRAHDEQVVFVKVLGTMRIMKPSLVPPADYEVNYFTEMDRECAILGLVSLGLAFVNIVCIFLAALVVLKIKEVAPVTNVSKTARFWKEDIKIARDYNSTMPAQEADDLGKQFLAEWATLNGLEPEELLADDAEATLTRLETLKDIMKDVENDEVYQRVSRSVVNPVDPRPLSRRLSASSPVQHPPPASSNRFSTISALFRSSWHSQTESGPAHVHPDLKDVELRRNPMEVPSTLQHRSSVAVLRQSLMRAENPYTLWPSVANGNDPANQFRFVVTPVIEEASRPVSRRISRFLQEPAVIVRETTC